jgi:DNA-binding transcriptional LysR family regulator
LAHPHLSFGKKHATERRTGPGEHGLEELSGRASPRVDLRHLRYFVALGEELHFGRAAERLGISQPPLSQQVARLETGLGVSLLRRTSRSVELTAAGRAFLAEARRTLWHAENAVRVAQQIDRGEVGELRVGFVPACGVIPRGVRRFVSRFPGVRLTLRHMTTTDQVEALGRGDLDVGFVYLPLDAMGLVVEEVQRVALVAAVPERHPLSHLASVPLSALVGEPYISVPRATAPGAFEAVMTQCRKAGFTPQSAHETDSLLARLRLVGAGFGVALVPSYAVRLPRPGVVLRPLRHPRISLAIGMVHASRSAAPALDRFLSTLREVARARPRDGQ